MAVWLYDDERILNADVQDQDRSALAKVERTDDVDQ